MTHRPARPATTLTEVLIAIFIMGIGLMAILSLFPLGAAQMAQALKDQRTAEAAANAAAMARVIWKQACDDDLSVGAQKLYGVDGRPLSRQRFMMALDDPSYNSADTNYADLDAFAIGVSPGQPEPNYDANTPRVQNSNMPNGASGFFQTMPVVPRTSTGPSYPVLVDPIGWQANITSAARKWWLPAPQTTIAINNQPMIWRIPRRTLYVRDTSQPPSATAPWIPLGMTGTARDTNNNPTPAAIALGGAQRIFKQFSLTDDLTFNDNGTPQQLSTGQLDRQGRYNWAYLFRRPNNADRTTVDISVILYSGRSIDVASQETAFAGTGTVGTFALTLAYASAKPAVRRGQWVLDATLWDAAGNLAPQGFFYRVVNVDDSTPGAVTLELQTPLLGGPSGANQRSIVVMENVVEVFSRVDDPHVGPPMPY